MLLAKNPTPRNIAFVSALLISVVPLGVMLFYTQNPYHGIVLFVSSATVSYFVIKNMLEIFIYRKIKVIYKYIHRHKRSSLSNQETDFYKRKDPIADVRQQVMDYVNHNQEELEELKKAETFRRQFLGNVSHELKTPITNIQGYVHTLLDGALFDEDVNENFLRKVSKNTERLVDMVDELTTISKLEVREISMEFETFDIRKLVEEVFESVELLSKKHNVTLSFKKGSSQNWHVSADPNKIHQVITNLLINAIKYGKEEGLVQVSFYHMEPNILVEVSDNGAGIEPVHLPRLFERFYRVDESRNRDEGGSGLGLAIVKHIIEAHDQTINVRSTVGQGTTFSFTLKKA